jgi:hypothetical protein
MSDFIPERVKAAVTERLEAAFAFDIRAFGQPVSLSEAVAVIQETPGVVFVDVDAFHRVDDVVQPPPRRERLAAAVPQPKLVLNRNDQPILGAELLVLDLSSDDIRVTQ